VEGASVARVARVHGINANQVFGWRRLYRAGRLGGASPAVKLLSVQVRREYGAGDAAHREHSLSADRTPSTASAVPGTIHIELRQAQVRIEGSADPGLVRVLLECLRA
jgi:transposase